MSPRRRPARQAPGWLGALGMAAAVPAAGIAGVLALWLLCVALVQVGDWFGGLLR